MSIVDDAISSLIVNPSSDIVDVEHFIIPMPQTQALNDAGQQLQETEKKMNVLKSSWVKWYRIFMRMANLTMGFMKESAAKRKIQFGLSIAAAEVMVVRLGIRAAVAMGEKKYVYASLLLMYMALYQATVIKEKFLQEQQEAVVDEINQIDIWSGAF